MSIDFEVRTSSDKLAQLQYELQKQLDQMAKDAEQLNLAYHEAQWNDSVSEKTRLTLNEYLLKLNKSLADLSGVVQAVWEMRQLAEQYESLE